MKQLKLRSVATCIITVIVSAGLVGITPTFGRPFGRTPSAHVNTQTAEIDALLTAVHELTSYNGDPAISAQHLATWSELWAEDASFLVNGATLYEGKEAIFANFFASAPFFHNNWIALTPSFRKQISIHDRTAEVYLECIWMNESETVVAKRSLHGTIKNVRGNWLFWHMNTDPAAPLF